MKLSFVILIFPLLMIVKSGMCQADDTLLNTRLWNAQWIAINDPSDKGTDYGVYYFRKSVNLKKIPPKFILHISADNHYKLFVNGNFVSDGPARGDLYHWNYETIDIAKYLTVGKNCVSAMVWNEGDNRPEYQISLRTSFIVQGNTAAEEIFNTDGSWKCIKDKAFSPLPGLWAVNGSKVNMNKTIMHWNSVNFDDNAWLPAKALFPGQPKGMSDGFGYGLVPSTLPPMEMTYQPVSVVRKVSGLENMSLLHLPLTIPANSKIMILLDQTQETNAYPTIKFSNGKGAVITLGYAEALYDKGSNFSRKSNRNDVVGKDFGGLTDSLISNGDKEQTYTSLLFRTFRYLQLTVQTTAQPLVIDTLYGTFTAYPLKAKAVFNSDNDEVKKILDIGWHTARLNAFDCYFTGQYYERLQYIGDARIQALINYYYTDDDRLTKNALNQIDESRLPEGITLSRYPTRGIQIIPTFSLLYIGMLHDYRKYRNDTDFIKEKLPGERAILRFFAKYQGEDGSLQNTPYWNFVDWANGKNWIFGSPPRSSDGSSSIIDMHLLHAYQWAADLESELGMKSYADLYKQKVEQLKQTIRKKYWDDEKKLYADTKEKNTFSQHANALALLTDVVDSAERSAFAKRLITDSSLTKCSTYFDYYLHEALVKGGLGNNYMKWLDPWRESIKIGLTTWAEEPNLYTTRSDCHAWGSSPNIEFFRTVLGVDSDAPGFKKIKVEPNLGSLTNASGEVPHPNGKVIVKYKLEKSKWSINISLPQTTFGIFIWKNKTYPLKQGNNSFML